MFHLKHYPIFLFLLLISFVGLAQPVANFKADKLSGCAPLAVQFTDLSSGGPASWSWDLGNGNTSVLQNPGATYTQAGVYTVKLTATNASGSNTMTKTAYITVHAKPSANFVADDTLGCAGVPVVFTNQSTSQTSTNTYYWTFGNGSSSNQQNTSHAYAPGTYNVYMSITDANGCKDDTLRTAYIKISQTKANFNFNSVACPAPTTVNFTNTSTGSGLTYNWVFGDGGTSTQLNPSHTFTTADTFGVKLIVKDANGCKDSVTKNMFVVDLKTNFKFNVTCYKDSFTVNFTDLTTPTPSAWVWNFGDGSISTTRNPTHTYDTSQTFNIKLTTGMGSACNNNITKTYTPVFVQFNSDSFSCRSPFPMTFDNNSTGDSLTYLWTFGSAGTSTQQNPNFTFTDSSQFSLMNITLSATDKFGCTRTFSDNAIISKPNANIFSEIREGCVPLTVAFRDTSKSVDQIIAWKWDFGNGITSTQQHPTVVYADTGHFTVKLRVTTADGCIDSVSFPRYIRSGFFPEYIDFTFYDTLCMNNPKLWVGQAGFSNPSININNWYWSFPYYPSGSGGFVNIYTSADTISNNSDSITYNVKKYWKLGYDTIYFKAGHNGCYRDTMKVSYTAGPDSWVYHDTSSWAYCSAPAIVEIKNATKRFSNMVGFYVSDVTTGQIINLDPDTSVINSVQLTHAGIYNLVVHAENDTSRLGGCTDNFTEYLIVVDSVHHGFKANPEIECINKTTGTTVAFTDTSKSFFGSVTLKHWDFGDGGYGAGSNPVHTYTSSGVYLVTYTLTTTLSYEKNDSIGVDGCTYVAYDTIIIHGSNSLFTADDTGICPGGTVNFTDNSTTTSDNIVSWKWDFGDGSAPVTAQNPSHTYQNLGSYDVKLVVTDSYGCADSIVKPAYIVVGKPTPNFTINSNAGCINTPLTFTNTSTGNVVSYAWEFGDGNTSTSANPTHLYAGAGNYNITLTVTDANGCDSSITKSGSVVIHPKPISNYSSDKVSAGCPKLPVQFTSDTTGRIVAWYWDFGNGSTSVLQNPTEVYSFPGQFDVSLIVTNVFGCKDTLLRSPYINIGGPKGVFTTDPDTFCIPGEVTFVGTVSDAVRYRWDFGDGNISSGNIFFSNLDTVTHTYTTRPQQGQKEITPALVLYDSTGCEVFYTGKLILYGPLANFSASDIDLCNADNVNFTNLTDILVSTNYVWDFGDGTTSTVFSPSHYFDSLGTFNVTLTATDVQGCSSTATQEVTILQRPTIQVSPDAPDGCIPHNITLEASRVGSTGSNIDSWLWDFGNGDTTSANPATHTYTTAGNFNVEVSAFYGGNCSVDTSFVIKTYLPPVANFYYQPDSIVPYGSAINFFSTSRNVTKWHWNFGNGDTSDVENPVYVFEQGGVYNVSLTVFDELGCADTISKLVIIAPMVPNVFTPNGDGINDVFFISGVESQNCTFIVYNRWGDVVFKSDNYQNDWDGTSQSGKPLSDGVYYYYIHCDYIKHTRGWVQILTN